MRSAEVYFFGRLAGRIRENEQERYEFKYDTGYLKSSEALPISSTLPLKEEAYEDRYLFPFFDGLIPEGWLLDIAEETWKLNPRDRFGLLLACCKDCIGAVSVREVTS